VQLKAMKNPGRIPLPQITGIDSVPIMNNVEGYRIAPLLLLSFFLDYPFPVKPEMGTSYPILSVSNKRLMKDSSFYINITFQLI
jgi:hypothetical protein